SFQASWTGCDPSVDSPSMVVIFLPMARLACKKQERTARPSISTVQAPHWPMPQPYFVPVRPIESRSTHNSGVSGSASTEYWTPLTRRVNAISEPPWALGTRRLINVFDVARRFITERKLRQAPPFWVVGRTYPGLRTCVEKVGTSSRGAA